MASFVKTFLETVVLYCQFFIIITFYVASWLLIQYKHNGSFKYVQSEFLNTDLNSLKT